MTVKTVCIEVAIHISHKDQKTSLFSEDQKKCKKNSSHSRFYMKISTKVFSNDDCENCCFYRGSTLISHKVGKASLFSEDQSKCVRKSSLTPVFKRKSARKVFPMMTVKTVCIEVTLLIGHKDEKTSLFSEDKLKSVRKSSLTPVFKWKSALKFFPMLTVKIVFIEVAILIIHKDQKTSLFSEDQKKCKKNSSHSRIQMKISTKGFSNDDCENCLYRGSAPYKS